MMKGLEKCGVDVVRRCPRYCGIVVVPIIMQPSSYGILGVGTELSQRVQGRLRVEELGAQPRLKRVLGAELTEAERILVITKTAMSFRSKFDIKNKIIRVYTLMLYGKTQLFLIQTDEITTFS